MPASIFGVAVASRLDLVGDDGQSSAGWLRLATGDEGADSRQANKLAFVGQLAQGAVDCHPRHAQLGDQLLFRGDEVAGLPFATTYFRNTKDFA